MYRLVIGTVPVADEIFPLGGRQGETVGLELRGGMLNGTRIAAATLYPLSGTRIMPARIAGAVLGPARPQVQSRRPISTWNRCRLWSFQLTRRSASQSDRARHRRRRSRRSCSTDGSTQRGKTIGSWSRRHRDSGCGSWWKLRNSGRRSTGCCKSWARTARSSPMPTIQTFPSRRHRPAGTVARLARSVVGFDDSRRHQRKSRW